MKRIEARVDSDVVSRYLAANSPKSQNKLNLGTKPNAISQYLAAEAARARNIRPRPITPTVKKVKGKAAPPVPARGRNIVADYRAKTQGLKYPMFFSPKIGKQDTKEQQKPRRGLNIIGKSYSGAVPNISSGASYYQKMQAEKRKAREAAQGRAPAEGQHGMLGVETPPSGMIPSVDALPPSAPLSFIPEEEPQFIKNAIAPNFLFQHTDMAGGPMMTGGPEQGIGMDIPTPPPMSDEMMLLDTLSDINLAKIEAEKRVEIANPKSTKQQRKAALATLTNIEAVQMKRQNKKRSGAQRGTNIVPAGRGGQRPHGDIFSQAERARQNVVGTLYEERRAYPSNKEIVAGAKQLYHGGRRTVREVTQMGREFKPGLGVIRHETARTGRDIVGGTRKMGYKIGREARNLGYGQDLENIPDYVPTGIDTAEVKRQVKNVLPSRAEIKRFISKRQTNVTEVPATPQGTPIPQTEQYSPGTSRAVFNEKTGEYEFIPAPKQIFNPQTGKYEDVPAKQSRPGYIG